MDAMWHKRKYSLFQIKTFERMYAFLPISSKRQVWNVFDIKMESGFSKKAR